MARGRTGVLWPKYSEMAVAKGKTSIVVGDDSSLRRGRVGDP